MIVSEQGRLALGLAGWGERERGAHGLLTTSSNVISIVSICY